MNYNSRKYRQQHGLIGRWIGGLLLVGVLVGVESFVSVGQAEEICEQDQAVAGKVVLDNSTNTMVMETRTNCQPRVEIVNSLQTVARDPEAVRRTTLVSLDPANQPFTIRSQNPSVSADGRFVAFDTFASVDGVDMGQVYVRDQLNQRTELISVDAMGQPGNGDSTLPRISATGRFVVFSSRANNLVPNDTNGATDIFLYDRQRDYIERINIASDGTQTNGGLSFYPFVSANGRYVVFTSQADNLVSNDTNEAEDIFLRDRVRGTTERISTARDGTAAGGLVASISADGRFIAYISTSDDLVSNDTNDAQDAFVYDRLRETTERVNVASDGTEAALPPGTSGFGLVFDAEIAPDGRFVVFSSRAANLVPNDTNEQTDVFVRDLVRDTTERVSIANDGSEGNDASSYAAITPGGRYVTFHSRASNLVDHDTNGVTDVFVRDMARGITERVSVASDGTEGNAASGIVEDQESQGFIVIAEPGIDWRGRTIVFASLANNLVSDDMDAEEDIFVRTRR